MSKLPSQDAGQNVVQRRWRVLLLEDHADTLRFMSRLLERMGLEVIPVTTCAAARHAARTLDWFDILIADALLDDGDGVALGAEFKVAHGCAVLITSGLSPQSSSLNSSIDYWISKPIKLPEFEETVSELMAIDPRP